MCLEIARDAVAQCFDGGYPTSGALLVTAEKLAYCVAAWMADQCQQLDNAAYYRGLLVECGIAIGPDAITCDDGSKVEEVLVAKIPELVRAIVKNSKETPTK